GAEAIFVAPDASHLGPGIAWDHGDLSSGELGIVNPMCLKSTRRFDSVSGTAQPIQDHLVGRGCDRKGYVMISRFWCYYAQTLHSSSTACSGRRASTIELGSRMRTSDQSLPSIQQVVSGLLLPDFSGSAHSPGVAQLRNSWCSSHLWGQV